MLKKLLLAVAAAVGLIASQGVAPAQGCSSPFCGGQGAGPRLPFFRQSPVPAFQAAPWYLYYPYNAHFQTPAPMFGAYYAPPGSGYGGMVNPYFPSPNYGAPQAMPNR